MTISELLILNKVNKNNSTLKDTIVKQVTLEVFVQYTRFEMFATETSSNLNA